MGQGGPRGEGHARIADAGFPGEAGVRLPESGSSSNGDWEALRTERRPSCERPRTDCAFALMVLGRFPAHNAKCLLMADGVSRHTRGDRNGSDRETADGASVAPQQFTGAPPLGSGDGSRPIAVIAATVSGDR